MPTIETTAGPLDYVDSGGPGPTLLFAHGLSMTHTQWDAVVPLLPGCRCVRPTLPMGGHRHPMRRGADLGHRGQARLLLELCELLDLRDVTLVLNDWGGGQFAVLEPGAARIARMVLVACEAFDNFPPPPARPLAAALAVPGVAWLVMQALRVRAVRHAPMAYGGLSLGRLPDEVMDEWFAPARRSAAIRRDFVAFARSAPDRTTLLDWSAELAGFAGPVLVVWAAQDRLMPAEHGPRLAELYPAGHLAVVPDAATLIPFDQPERLAELIRGFLADTGAPPVPVSAAPPNGR